MSNFLHEAFQALKLLESETFELDDKGVTELADYMNSDIELDDTVAVIDPNAETADELEATYIGKMVLECPACHSVHFCTKENIVKDEESEVVNLETECPHCYSTEGFKIVGEIAPYEDITVDADSDVKVEVDGKQIAADDTDVAEVENTTEETDVVEESVGQKKVADKDQLRKRFAGRFSMKESIEAGCTECDKTATKKRHRHITRNEDEEALQACQKGEVDTTKSIAGELKEAKKRHLTRRNEEETLRKC